MTITIVATTAQLIATLSGALAGDTIELAPGTYSNVGIHNDYFRTARTGGPSQVYIRSEFVDNQAILKDINIQSSSGLAFGNLRFSTVGDAAGAFGAAGTTPFYIAGASNISLRGITVSGNPAGTLANTISGLFIRGSSYVTVTNSSFSNLHFAIDQFQNSHINITNNLFSHNFDDGVRGGGTSNINISGNTFTDLHRDPTDTDHPDCIQFWTTNTTTSASNITITNNTFTRGAGGAVQGIFIADEVGNLPYHNVTITGNNLTGALWNGIALYHVQGGVVDGNIVRSYNDYNSAIDLYNSQDIAETNNSADSYAYTGSTSLTLSNNTITRSLGSPPGASSAVASNALSPSLLSGSAVSSDSWGGPEPWEILALSTPLDDTIAAPAPEPESWTLMSMALGFLGLFQRDRRSRMKVRSQSRGVFG